MLTIRELRSDAEILSAFPLMKVLRERLQADRFLSDVRRQQVEGYELIGAFAGETLVGLAGVRRTHTLSRGEHLFVDDLVTGEAARSAGYGRALLVWLAHRAQAEGIPRIHLDARFTAKGFYAHLGFTFSTSVPCWIDAETLARGPVAGTR